MATLEALKKALRKDAASLPSRPLLTDAQYKAGFEVFMDSAGLRTYHDFIIPQLSQLIDSFPTSQKISVLEIGPGPKTVLASLSRRLQERIYKYVALEPNELFVDALERSFSERSRSLPTASLAICQAPFDIRDDEVVPEKERYDLVLFCHSMYGMGPGRQVIEKALDSIREASPNSMVAVFHRKEALVLEGLICNQTAIFPEGIIRVKDTDEDLDTFASFIAGFDIPAERSDRTGIQREWRQTCRALGRRDDPGHLTFSAPEIMATFTRSATHLEELKALVPVAEGKGFIKNRHARLYTNTPIVTPTDVTQLQACVRWAREQKVPLTILGGGHSEQCLWPNVVAVNMAAFKEIDLLAVQDFRLEDQASLGHGPLIIAGAGCKTGDIVRKAMHANVTVPLGARPSVGAGSWLQGGIGHMARLHGLACDAVVGAYIMSVDTGSIFSVGCVPPRYTNESPLRPENEEELLWALKGAGTNFGIVLSVVFRTFAASKHFIHSWTMPLADSAEAERELERFDQLVAQKLPRQCSADAYLFSDADQLHLGVTLFDSSDGGSGLSSAGVSEVLGPEDPDSHRAVDNMGLFEADMYMTKMHGGHGGGKTSAFKRCIFLRLGSARVIETLTSAVNNRPTRLSYIHLLHGDGAIADVAEDATAFGCRSWDFACVITAVWPREQDESEAAEAAVRWVYQVVEDLLPMSLGAYSADLGSDPRDAALAAKAYGPNRSRLSRLKQELDPNRMLAHACPLSKAPMGQKLVILVTGKSGAGKDYSAAIWASVFDKYTDSSVVARVVSISEQTKRDYAAANGADVGLLLNDRAYKERHRPALTRFHHEQARLRPRLQEEHFVSVVNQAADVDVLLITGMRDEAPAARLAHLVPACKLLDVRVEAQKRWVESAEEDPNDASKDVQGPEYSPSFIFENNVPGTEAAEDFAHQHLIPLAHEDLQRLAAMVRRVPDFPRSGVDFRHVLGILEQPLGIALSTSLLRTQFSGDWSQVDSIAALEAGSWAFASALASAENVPMLLIRKARGASKLPPPTISVPSSASHVSDPEDDSAPSIEMGPDAVGKASKVVVVDDVLASGRSMLSVLWLLVEKRGLEAGNIRVMVVAEFPLHGGREMLVNAGFGKVIVQSLLVFDGR